MGFSVSGAGDVNDDKLEDFIIGANWASPSNEAYTAGKGYVFFGRKSQFVCFIKVIDLPHWGHAY